MKNFNFNEVNEFASKMTRNFIKVYNNMKNNEGFEKYAHYSISKLPIEGSNCRIETLTVSYNSVHVNVQEKLANGRYARSTHFSREFENDEVDFSKVYEAIIDMFSEGSEVMDFVEWINERERLVNERKWDEYDAISSFKKWRENKHNAGAVAEAEGWKKIFSYKDANYGDFYYDVNVYYNKDLKTITTINNALTITDVEPEIVLDDKGEFIGFLPDFFEKALDAYDRFSGMYGVMCFSAKCIDEQIANIENL